MLFLVALLLMSPVVLPIMALGALLWLVLKYYGKV
jgi:hypothetical protein